MTRFKIAAATLLLVTIVYFVGFKLICHTSQAVSDTKGSIIKFNYFK